MRLNEFFTVRRGTLLEKSVPGTGAIHIDEIAPTIAHLEKVLGMSLADDATGSVGKTEFSGDLDFGLDLTQEQAHDFIDKLKSTPGISDVTLKASISFKFKIQNYDANKQSDRPRTGFVQVDFFLGDPEWLKTYYHSPAQGESAYKGGVRTILLSVIAALYDRNDSGDTTEDGVPLKSERYMLSPKDGLVRIIQTPIPKKSGQGYTKQKTKEYVGGPWKNADSIAKQLGLGQGAALNSYESLKAAMERNYPPEVTQQILTAFANTGELARHGVPADIAHLKK